MKFFIKAAALTMLIVSLTFSACGGGGDTGGGDTETPASTLFANKSPIAPGDTSHCSNGGIRIDMGFDVNKNNVLDTDEITKTEYVCNGEDASSHPFVVYTSPTPNETDVELDTVISAVFNTEMDETTITSQTFTVKDSGGNSVTGTVSYSGIVAVFTPDAPLNINMKYTVNLASTIENDNDIAMGYNHKIYFTGGKAAVIYRANEADGGTVPVDANKYNTGDPVTASANTGTLYKTGYSFSGWNTASDGSGTNYAANAVFPMGNANVILYAKWIVSNDYISPNIGTLKYVPAGSFQRDSVSTNISTITTPYRMSQYEITRAQYLAVMGTDPSYTPYSSGTNDPVQQVTWYDSVEFCNKLSILEGLTPVYTITGRTPATGYPITNATVAANWSANGYRLPTEMEWMWAAMGATSGSGYTSPVYLTGYGKLFAGSDSVLANGSGGTRVIGDYAWWGYTSGNAGATTHPVGTRYANELGLYDMSGNVWEWCWDWYGGYTAGTVTSDSAAGKGAASGTGRIMRGGCFSYNASYCPVALRDSSNPGSWGYQYITFGFRVVRQ